MRSIFLYITFILILCFTAKAQLGIPGQEGMIVDGKSTLYISPSTTLHIDGDFYIKKSQFPLWVRSNGTISLTGNLTCNDPLICERASESTPTSTFIFSPRTPTVKITSTTDSLVLYHTIINKTNAIVKISSGTQVKILDTLDLQAGSIQLDGGNIHFRPPTGTPTYVNHPYLKNENNQNRIFGDSGQVVMSFENSEDVTTPANIGLTLKGGNVKNATFTIRRGHTKQIYAGNGSIKRYFDITSNQPLNNDSLLISYIDSAEYINLGINKNKFKVFASKGSDMDYIQLSSSNSIAQHQASATTKDLDMIGIGSKSFRVTIADEDCSNPPISKLTADTLHLCQGVSQILDAGNTSSIPNSNLSWSWNTGATTQTITITPSASIQQFTVALRDVRGCITKDTVVVMPTAPTPVVNFTAYASCLGDSVKLISTSKIASGTISTYNWQLGDGTTLNTASTDTIKKLYATAGNYFVRLTATSNYGCTASKLDSVRTFALPIPNFTSNFDCAGNFMIFNSNSTVDFGKIKTNYWNLDTVASAALVTMDATVSPTQVYTTPGNYFVKLMVETYQGCKSSITKEVVVNQRNKSAFTAIAAACSGDTISFINNSVCNTNSCSYSWDFGDGTQSLAFSPKKIFTKSSIYNVKLKIVSAGACTDSTSIAITVSPKPAVDFTSNSVCSGSVSYFTNTSSISSGTIASYDWNFGNNSTVTTTNASLTYPNEGFYKVKLTATSDHGCVSEILKTVSVFEKPVANYSVSNVCKGQPSLFNQNSIGTSLAYVWDFGNTVTSTSNNPTYTYPASGNFTTSLVVTNPSGCSDTSVITTTVFSIPNPALGGSIATCGTSYVLDAGLGASYFWEPSNATSQVITVNASGKYKVTVTDINGCIGKDAVDVKLNKQVKPQLGIDTISCGPYVLNAGYPGSSFLWNTGATTQTLSATISSTYIVTVTDMNKCVGKDTVEVIVNEIPTLSLGPDITQCKTGKALILIPATNATTYLWSTGSNEPTIPVNVSNNYSLTVTATNGCTKSDTVAVNILPTPIVALGTDTTVCGDRLLDAKNIGASYLWSTGSTAQTITATNDGDYIVTVTNPLNGCAAKDTIHLIINKPLAVSLGNDTSTCSNALFVLNAGNPGAGYNWSTGDTTQTIVVGSSGAYGVTVSNGACSTFDAINILVLNVPTVDLGANTRYLCNSGDVTLDAGNPGNVKWGSDNGFSSTLSSITINKAGKYWAVVSNGVCSSADTVQVIQSSQNLTAYFIASTIDTVGKSIKFVDVSQPAPTTWLWDFGDGFTSTIQSPEHIFLTPQTFNVSLLVSNGFCTSRIAKTLKVFRLNDSLPKSKNASSLDLLNFSMYPNPANASFKTIFELNDLAKIQLSVYEITGKLVYQQRRDQVRIFEEETSISDLTNGLYLVEIIAESHKGFVIQKSKLTILK